MWVKRESWVRQRLTVKIRNGRMERRSYTWGSIIRTADCFRFFLLAVNQWTFNAKERLIMNEGQKFLEDWPHESFFPRPCLLSKKFLLYFLFLHDNVTITCLTWSESLLKVDSLGSEREESWDSLFFVVRFSNVTVFRLKSKFQDVNCSKFKDKDEMKLSTSI